MISYRERLTPSLWLLVAVAVLAPMIALVLIPVGAGVALIAAVGVTAIAILAAVAGSPVVEVRNGVLRAGRARIEVEYLGRADSLTGDEARHARGPGLGRDDWHLIRGGIDGIVQVEVLDPLDPVPRWVISTRTPDRLAYAIERAKLSSRTPDR